MLVTNLRTAQRLNVAGAAHQSLSRKKLREQMHASNQRLPQSRRDAWVQSVTTGAWRGAYVARTVAAPLTVSVDFLLSNGRARSVREHPCDVGVVRACITGALAVMFVAIAPGLVASEIGSLGAAAAVAAGGGAVAADAIGLGLRLAFTVPYLVGLCALQYQTPGFEYVWGIKACLYLTVTVSQLAGLLLGVTTYTLKQALGLATALGLKGPITGLGMALGAMMGAIAGVHAAASYRPAPGDALDLSARRDLDDATISQQKHDSINRETLVALDDITSVRNNRWIFIQGYGFDSRELATSLRSSISPLHSPYRDVPWRNPYTRVPLSEAERFAVMNHPDGTTREMLADDPFGETNQDLQRPFILWDFEGRTFNQPNETMAMWWASIRQLCW